MATLLLFAVIVEYFKMPIGGTPNIGMMIGRCLIAAVLLISLPDIMNFLTEISDSIAAQLGDLNNINLVLGRMGEKLKTLSWSWTSIKDSVVIIISFITFFILYINVYFAEAGFIFVWTLLYVFSPILILCYIFPATSGATRGLFQSLIEVSLWKIVWSCLSTLLWSMALSQINQPQEEINFLSAIVINLLLALSVLMTPQVVHSLISGGVSQLAGNLSMAAMGATAIGPGKVLGAVTGIRNTPGSLIKRHIMNTKDSSNENLKK
jgi:hypothetical protein